MCIEYGKGNRGYIRCTLWKMFEAINQKSMWRDNNV